MKNINLKNGTYLVNRRDNELGF